VTIANNLVQIVGACVRTISIVTPGGEARRLAGVGVRLVSGGYFNLTLAWLRPTHSSRAASRSCSPMRAVVALR